MTLKKKLFSTTLVGLVFSFSLNTLAQSNAPKIDDQFKDGVEHNKTYKFEASVSKSFHVKTMDRELAEAEDCALKEIEGKIQKQITNLENLCYDTYQRNIAVITENSESSKNVKEVGKYKRIVTWKKTVDAICVIP